MSSSQSKENRDPLVVVFTATKGPENNEYAVCKAYEIQLAEKPLEIGDRSITFSFVEGIWNGKRPHEGDLLLLFQPREASDGLRALFARFPSATELDLIEKKRGSLAVARKQQALFNRWAQKILTNPNDLEDWQDWMDFERRYHKDLLELVSNSQFRPGLRARAFLAVHAVDVSTCLVYCGSRKEPYSETDLRWDIDIRGFINHPDLYPFAVDVLETLFTIVKDEVVEGVRRWQCTAIPHLPSIKQWENLNKTALELLAFVPDDLVPKVLAVYGFRSPRSCVYENDYDGLTSILLDKRIRSDRKKSADALVRQEVTSGLANKGTGAFKAYTKSLNGILDEVYIEEKVPFVTDQIQFLLDISEETQELPVNFCLIAYRFARRKKLAALEKNLAQRVVQSKMTNLSQWEELVTSALHRGLLSPENEAYVRSVLETKKRERELEAASSAPRNKQKEQLLARMMKDS